MMLTFARGFDLFRFFFCLTGCVCSSFLRLIINNPTNLSSVPESHRIRENCEKFDIAVDKTVYSWLLTHDGR